MILDDLVDKLEDVRRRVRSHPHFGDMEVNRSFAAVGFDTSLCEAIVRLVELSEYLRHREDPSSTADLIEK